MGDGLRSGRWAKQQGCASGVCETGADENSVAGRIRERGGGKDGTSNMIHDTAQFVEPAAQAILLLGVNVILIS
jgi:hypothetical protein